MSTFRDIQILPYELNMILMYIYIMKYCISL